MSNNQMKPLQALELLMTRVQPSEDNIEKARVEFETIKSALKEYELMKQTKFIVADKKVSDDDLEKLKNQRMFVGSLEAIDELHCVAQDMKPWDKKTSEAENIIEKETQSTRDY